MLILTLKPLDVCQKHVGRLEPNWLILLVFKFLQKQNVDVYLNGHDHCLQHIKREDSNVHFVTSGAGSKSFQGLHEGQPEDGLQFGYDGQGFVSVSMGAHDLRIDFHDALGQNLYQLDLHKWAPLGIFRCKIVVKNNSHRYTLLHTCSFNNMIRFRGF